MKKVILSVALMSLGSFAMGQGFYTSFNLGYGFGTPGDADGQVDVVDGSGNTTSTVEYSTYGGGLNLGLTPGFMISENIGFELGLNYLLGSEVTTWDMTAPGSSTTIKSKANQFRILPTVVLSTGGEGFSAYAKAGLIMPVTGSTTTNIESSGTGFTSSQEMSSKGAFSLGFQGALGVDYGISDKLSVFGELSHVSLRIKSKSRSSVSSVFNGVDQLAGDTTYDKETVYVSELNSSSNNGGYNPNPVNEGLPREELSSSSNYNALFINIGIKFRL